MWDTQALLSHLYSHPSPTKSNYISITMALTLFLPAPGHLLPPPLGCSCPTGLCGLFSTSSYRIWLSYTSAKGHTPQECGSLRPGFQDDTPVCPQAGGLSSEASVQSAVKWG